MKTLLRTIIGCAAAATLAPSPLSTALAQSQGGDVAKQDVKVMSLQHMDANEARGHIIQLMPPEMQGSYRLIADTRTNALLLSTSSAEVVEQLRDLLEKLDVAASTVEADEVVIETIPLGRPEMGFMIADLIASVFETGPSQRGRTVAVRVAFDRMSGQIVARGRKRDVEMIKEVVKQLDAAASGRDDTLPSQEMAVRLVWLAGGLGDDVGRAPSADMAPALKQLERYGIEGLRQVASMIVRATPDRPFEASCSVAADELWQMVLSGQIRTSEDRRVALDIGIDARPGARQPLHMNTTITTSVGQLVVLSVSPIGDVDSVFVVQLVDSSGT